MLVKEIVIVNASWFCNLVKHALVSMERAEDVNRMVISILNILVLVFWLFFASPV